MLIGLNSTEITPQVVLVNYSPIYYFLLTIIEVCQLYRANDFTVLSLYISMTRKLQQIHIFPLRRSIELYVYKCFAKVV